MVFEPLLNHCYSFCAGIRVTVQCTVSSNAFRLSYLKINVTELSIEGQWYSKSDYFNKLVNDYGFRPELATTLIHELYGNMCFDRRTYRTNSYIGLANNDSISTAGLVDIECRVGDQIVYNNNYGGSEKTSTITYITAELINNIRFIMNLDGVESNKSYTYNLEFVPTRTVLYGQVENWNSDHTSYTIDYTPLKTINITNTGVIDLGTDQSLIEYNITRNNVDRYDKLTPESVVSGIFMRGNTLYHMTTELYMTVLSGSSDKVGLTYQSYGSSMGACDSFAVYKELTRMSAYQLFGDFYALFGTDSVVDISTVYSRTLAVNSVRYTEDYYSLATNYNRWYISNNASVTFANSVVETSNDDEYSVDITVNVRTDVVSSNVLEGLPEHSVVFNVYAGDTLLGTLYSEDNSITLTYTFTSNKPYITIPIDVVASANPSAAGISDDCNYSEVMHFQSNPYTLVHTTDISNFAFKVGNENVFIGNVSRYVQNKLCCNNIAYNSDRVIDGFTIDNEAILVPDPNNTSRFLNAYKYTTDYVSAEDGAHALATIYSTCIDSELELYNIVLIYNGYDYTNERVSYKYVALYKHPDWYSGGTYMDFFNSLS